MFCLERLEAGHEFSFLDTRIRGISAWKKHGDVPIVQGVISTYGPPHIGDRERDNTIEIFTQRRQRNIARMHAHECKQPKYKNDTHSRRRFLFSDVASH